MGADGLFEERPRWRGWMRWGLIALGVLLALAVGVIAVTIPGKIRFARTGQAAHEALAAYEGAMVEISADGHASSVSVVTRSGDYLTRHGPDGTYVSARLGNERIEYCLAWRLASRWKSNKETGPGTGPPGYQVLVNTVTSSRGYWLNPLVTVDVTETDDAVTLEVRIRRLLPRGGPAVFTLKTVLDPESRLPRENRLGMSMKDHSLSTSYRLLEYYRERPSGPLDPGLPSDVVDLAEEARHPILADGDAGLSGSIFRCRRDGRGGLLLCFDVPARATFIGEGIEVTDAETGVDLTAGRTAYHLWWPLSAERAAVVWHCPGALDGGPGPDSVDVAIRGRLMERQEEDGIVRFAAVGSARFVFADVPVEASDWAVFPECPSPPWFETRLTGE